MKKPVYAIKDIKIGFLQPQIEIADEVAKRNFAYAMNNVEYFAFMPKDFQLFKIGFFDDQKGQFENIMPEFMCDGDQMIGVGEK